MNILSIGNSFSQDAQRYLHFIAKSDNFDLTCVNLFIGGCPIFTHYRNICTDASAYTLEINGFDTAFKVSIKEALLSREWDVVTLQQASHESFNFDKYVPYINTIADYIRKYAPKAKIVIHQTWSYEEGSERLLKFGFKNQMDMFLSLQDAYNKAAKEINADFIIPSGEAMQYLLKNGIKVHRDGFHLSLGAGRYCAALLWYALLSGNDIENNSFCDFDEELSEENIKTIKKCVIETIKNKGMI